MFVMLYGVGKVVCQMCFVDIDFDGFNFKLFCCFFCDIGFVIIGFFWELNIEVGDWSGWFMVFNFYMFCFCQVGNDISDS